MEQSLLTSATLDVELSFSPHDLALAKIVVRALIGRGEWEGPSNLLMVPDHIADEWLEAEAIKYLQLQKARRQDDAKGNSGSPLRRVDEGERQLSESLRSLSNEHGAEL